jgi:hypothetical protein
VQLREAAARSGVHQAAGDGECGRKEGVVEAGRGRWRCWCWKICTCV